MAEIKYAKRSIDASALINDIQGSVSEVCLNAPYDEEWFTRLHNRMREIIAIIERQPSVEPERPKGRWVWDVETHGNPMYGVDEDFGWRCSECKVWADEYGVDGDIYEEPPTNILHFCPNCGVDMRGESE